MLLLGMFVGATLGVVVASILRVAGLDEWDDWEEELGVEELDSPPHGAFRPRGGHRGHLHGLP